MTSGGILQLPQCHSKYKCVPGCCLLEHSMYAFAGRRPGDGAHGGPVCTDRQVLPHAAVRGAVAEHRSAVTSCTRPAMPLSAPSATTTCERRILLNLERRS